MQTSPQRRRTPAAIALAALASALFVLVSPAPSHADDKRAAVVAKDVSVASSVTTLTKNIALPVRANMLGVTYIGGDAEIAVRVRRAGGGWSGWEELHPSDIAPDRGSPEGSSRRATEPFWAGTVDRVLLRVVAGAPVRDVRLHAINTLGDAVARPWFTRVFAAAASWLSTPRADAKPAVPSIVSRAGWGADERWRRCCPRYSPTVEVAFVHHTVSSNTYSWSDAPAMIRAIYRYHRYSLDYDDIAYNFVIDRFGRVFEGRSGGVDKPVTGAHTEGMNSKTTGIALLGTFSSAYPSGSMTLALKKFLAWKLDVHHIPGMGTVPMTSGGSNKLRKGQTVWLNRISGHRDAQATDCPGNRVYGQLPDVRKTVMAWGAPKTYLNSTPQTLRADGDGTHETVATKVWMSSTLNWKIDFRDQAGTVFHSVSGKGAVAEASWNGLDVLGRAAETGAGRIEIDAWDDRNTHATLATVPVWIVRTHPAGTVLSANGTVVFLDESGAARPVPSSAVYASWFRSTETVTTAAGELARYGTGAPLGFRDGTIVKTPSGDYWIINAGTRRRFTAPAVYQALGFSDASALAVTDADLDAIPQGAPISDTTLHPDGSVVLDSSKVAWVISGGRRLRVPSLPVRRSWYRDAEVVAATPADLALPQGQDVTFRAGTVLKLGDGYWIVSGGQRRLFRDRGLMAALGYRTSAALPVTWAEIGVLPNGPAIG